MKSSQSPHPTTRLPRRLQPKYLDEATEDRVLQMLCGEGDPHWHGRIKSVLAKAGIATRRIEREAAHLAWQAWLTRTTFDLSPDTKTAIRQLRKVLAKGGIKILRDEFNIIDRRGDKLRCLFLLDLGVPGVA